MTIYNLLAGAGGLIFVNATGGSLSTQTIGLQTFNVHTFTSSSTLTVTQAAPTGATVDVFGWGAAGGAGGRGGN